MHDSVSHNSLPRGNNVLYILRFSLRGCNFYMVNFEHLSYCLLGDWKTDCLIYRVKEEHVLFLE